MLAAHHCPVTRAGLLLTALSCIAITFESIIMVAAVSSNQTSSACLTKECSRSEKSEKQSAHRALTSRGCCLCLREGLAASSAPSSISTCGARRYRWRCYAPSCTHHVSSASLSLEATALQQFTDECPKCPCPAAMRRLVLSVREASRPQFLLSCLQQRTNSVTVVFRTRVVQSITSCDRPGG